MSYKYPSMEESEGTWKHPEDQTVYSENELEDELDLSADSMKLNILSKYGKVGFEEGDDYCLRLNSFGDKTHALDVVNPNAITRPLIQALQTWLKTYYPYWRIGVPCGYDASDVITIYDSDIVLSNKHGKFTDEAFSRLQQLLRDTKN